MVSVGALAPDFTLDGAFRGKVSRYTLRQYRGRWLILFFYPADFTFICPTEVTGFSRLAADFRAEEAEILGASVDPPDTHLAWIEELGGVEYPLLSDVGGAVSRAYGVLNEIEGVSERATFIIDPGGVVDYVVISHKNVGRSVEETLRVLKALRTDRLCPSGWEPGGETGDLKLRY